MWQATPCGPVSFSSFQNPVTVARMYDTADRCPLGGEIDPGKYLDNATLYRNVDKIVEKLRGC